MSLESIVDVQITTNSKGVTRAGFGVPLLAAFHTAWAELWREYDSIGSVEDDFAANTPAHKMATSVFSQSPKPKKVIIGRLQTAHTQIVRLTPANIVEGFIYSFTVTSPDGTVTTISRTVPGASSVAAEVTALTALLTAISGLSASDDTTHVTCTVDVAGTIFYYEGLPGPDDMEFKEMTAVGSVSADLAAIDDENSTWYGLATDTQGEAVLNAAATFIEAREKIGLFTTRDDEVGDPGVTTDIMSDLKANAMARSYALYNREHNAYAGLGWAGGMFPRDPGSATWKFKTIAGAEVDTIKSGFATAIEGKNGNHYQPVAGVNITCPGKVGAGEFIDIVRGRDWMVARMRERVFGALANNPKIPYTDEGVAIIVGLVRAQIQEGIDNGFVAASPEPVVTAPLVADVSSADKIARLLPDVEFEATLAGAIHAVQIRGVLKI